MGSVYSAMGSERKTKPASDTQCKDYHSVVAHPGRHQISGLSHVSEHFDFLSKPKVNRTDTGGC